MLINILNLILPVIAGLVLIAAVLFFLRAMRARTVVNRQPYDVGRQQARQKMQIAFARAVVSLVLGLILIGIYGLSFRPAGLLASPPTATATVTVQPTRAVTPTITVMPTSRAETATPEPSPTNPLLTATETPTLTPTLTAAPEPTTATVNSPIVGLYLREAPGGTQEVELLPDGTVLTLLEGQETVDGVLWQQVQAPSGVVGWVSSEYIIYGESTPESGGG